MGLLNLSFLPQRSECEDNSMPTVHNLVPIINDQSQYIHHLEAEVKFCKVSYSLGLQWQLYLILKFAILSFHD